MTAARGTQAARLLAYLRSHPGATPMQLITELGIPKYTSRESDLREAGYIIDVTRDEDGTTHHWLVERPVQTVLFETVTG